MAKPGDVIANPRIGARVVFLRTGQETQGQLLEMDLFIRSGGKAPPKHIHPRQEERFRVVAGSVTTWVSGKESTLRAGEECTAPKGALHTWWNSGESEAHVRVEFRPALKGDRALEAIYGMFHDGIRNPLQFAVTFWTFREEGGFPGVMAKIALAGLAGLGRLLGYKPDYPYPYGRTEAGDKA
jgi:quercetin dioxygenase-like cupin family protein